MGVSYGASSSAKKKSRPIVSNCVLASDKVDSPSLACVVKISVSLLLPSPLASPTRFFIRLDV